MTELHLPTIDEMIDLPDPGNPRISPDGRLITFIIRKPDWKENEFYSQIWLVGLDTRGECLEPRPLTPTKTSSYSPRWSPDGKWLAFLTKRESDRFQQIYRISTFGGEAERLTEVDKGVERFAWSPDSKAITFTAQEPDTQAEKDRREKYGDYLVDEEDYRRSQLWLLRISEKKILKLTGGDAFHVVNFDWHPDNNSIAFETCPSPDVKDFDAGRIAIIKVDTLEVKLVTEPGCSNPRWSPSGDQLVFTRFETPSLYANNSLWVLDAANGESRQVSTDFPELIWLQDWGPDGIYFISPRRTSNHVIRIDPASGIYQQLTPDEPLGWTCFECSLSADFSCAALIACDAKNSKEVVLLNIQDGSIQALTSFNQLLKDWQLGQSELIQWNSTDRLQIEGVLIKPAPFKVDEKYPLLVVLHGGPVSASHLGLLSGPERRYYPIHQWVNKGALVLQVNYRGSCGYGKDFRALNVRNLGIGDYWDVISGVEALIEKGWVDPQRLGVMGWSQGGYISAFCATYSDRFQAASVGAGISNWVTYYVSTDIHPFTRQYLQSTPWDDAQVYQKTSPMTYIRQARTPTLIQHGEFDRRVPIQNAFELYQGLKDLGVETKLVVYRGMPHGITRPRLVRQAMEENQNWFNRWLWGENASGNDLSFCYIALESAEKDSSEESLPALKRFNAPRIQEVYRWAQRDRVEFRLFHGPGLVRAEETIPCDASLLTPANVSATAEKIAGQIKEQKLKKLVLYTGEVKKEPTVLIYLGCLQVAAGIVGDITIDHRIITDKGW